MNGAHGTCILSLIRQNIWHPFLQYLCEQHLKEILQKEINKRPVGLICFTEIPPKKVYKCPELLAELLIHVTALDQIITLASFPCELLTASQR